MSDHASNPAAVRAEVENELSDLVEKAATQERHRIASLQPDRQRFAASGTIGAQEGSMPTDYAADITLVEVLHDLRERGYTGEFRLERDGAVFCAVCGLSQRAQELITHGMRRVEGASDPGDEAMVLAIACRGCGERGAIVLRYGPEAGVADATLLAGIDQGQILTIPPVD